MPLQERTFEAVLFPTTDFAIFFLLVFLGHWLLNPFPKVWKTFMLVASYVFYSWWNWHFIFLLGGITVIAQAGAMAIVRQQGERPRRWCLAGSIAAMLAVLGWFKYYGFFALNLDNSLRLFHLGSPLPLMQIVLPVGISFFTFMAISYVVDVYRGTIGPASWMDFAVYLSFFPHLVAGPIVRGSELLPQVRTRRDPRRIDLSRAAYLIFGGLFKKVVIASFLATSIVDPVFAAPGAHSSLEILVAVYAYAVQIYADFSGYTDIAIGIALLLGFQFPANFEGPYTARSTQDFWRRWHMTLSRWFRDYVYIPLGGNRGGDISTSRNLFLTMLLAGLWHGASWTFVVWGGYYGVCQVAGFWRRRSRVARGLPAMSDGPGDRVVQRVVTFNLVCLGWVFFRSDSLTTAFQLLGRMFTAWGPAPLVTPLVLATIALMLAAQYVPRELPARVLDRFSGLGPVVQGAILAGVLYAIVVLGPQGVAPFIYFQF
jgi:D-alanyl-lipoteichoic acid acyltransferase DltB (MBOAT superfamily)